MSPGSAPGESARVRAVTLRRAIFSRTDADFLNHPQFCLLWLFRWTEQIHAGVLVLTELPQLSETLFFFFFPSHISASSHLLPIENAPCAHAGGMLNPFFSPFFPAAVPQKTQAHMLFFRFQLKKNNKKPLSSSSLIPLFCLFFKLRLKLSRGWSTFCLGSIPYGYPLWLFLMA